MLLSISVDGPGAESLSFILQKDPTKVFERGDLKVFFPKYEKERSSVVAMSVPVHTHKLWDANTPLGGAHFKPNEYALSSLFCREIRSAFGTAVKGQYHDEKDKAMADTPLDLVVDALPFSTSLADEQIRGLFKPLGYHGFTPSYSVDHTYQHPWMPKKHRVLEVAIRGNKTVREVLRHLLVLIPVISDYGSSDYGSNLDLDADRLKDNEDWIGQHPMRDIITSRFLHRHNSVIRKANPEALAQIGITE